MILTYIQMQKQVDKLIPRCRCITKPVNAHTAQEHTATQTHSSEHRLEKKEKRSVNTALDTRRHTEAASGYVGHKH